MTITYNDILSTKLNNHDNSTSKSLVSSKKRNKRECESSITIKKHNTRQGSSLFNIDKENINLSKNKTVKNKYLVIKANKKNKINEYDDVLEDNNYTTSIVKKQKEIIC